jgi:hypothetical protein
MSFSTKLKETPKSILEDQIAIGGRLVMTIPFGSSVDNMSGFISILGDVNNLPVLTLCISSPNSDKSVVSSVVFKSSDHYLNFVDFLNIDGYLKFKRSEEKIH